MLQRDSRCDGRRCLGCTSYGRPYARAVERGWVILWGTSGKPLELKAALTDEGRRKGLDAVAALGVEHAARSRKNRAPSSNSVSALGKA